MKDHEVTFNAETGFIRGPSDYLDSQDFLDLKALICSGKHIHFKKRTPPKEMGEIISVMLSEGYRQWKRRTDPAGPVTPAATPSSSPI